jgi:hypothetical protein
LLPKDKNEPYLCVSGRSQGGRKSSVAVAHATPAISRGFSFVLSRNSIVLLDLSVVFLAYWIALRILLTYTTLRLGIPNSAIFILLLVATKGLALWQFGVFRGSLHYAGIRELVGINCAMLLGAGVLFAASHLVAAVSSAPLALFILDASLCGIVLGMVHFSLRMYEGMWPAAREAFCDCSTSRSRRAGQRAKGPRERSRGEIANMLGSRGIQTGQRITPEAKLHE